MRNWNTAHGVLVMQGQVLSCCCPFEATADDANSIFMPPQIPRIPKLQFQKPFLSPSFGFSSKTLITSGLNMTHCGDKLWRVSIKFSQRLRDNLSTGMTGRLIWVREEISFGRCQNLSSIFDIGKAQGNNMQGNVCIKGQDQGVGGIARLISDLQAVSSHFLAPHSWSDHLPNPPDLLIIG